MDPSQQLPPRWISWALLLAGAYNVVWGLWVIIFPAHFWRLLALPQPNYPELWQCIGMIVGVYGVGYIIAARDPARHWLIVLVGLLGKVLGPIGLVLALLSGKLAPRFGAVNVFNDFVWWIPFTLALIFAWRVNHTRRVAQDITEPDAPLPEAAGRIQSRGGDTLLSLSQKAPHMVTFLRHPG